MVSGSDLEGLPQGFLPLRRVERWFLIVLCRPIATGVSSEPATNREIETEMCYAADRVKWLLRTLILRFGLADSPGDQRALLADIVLSRGILRPEDCLGAQLARRYRNIQ